ncbi:hypothetical protein M513_07899 [Trichuris suis]|uniref:DDE-1 domain-containing protein n=1 Tax=Trichuris suis TaxID=68888 RepID=A0A085M253_9BILA|nr:hypothetical protein M513_07899 [Trichuris suis]
MRMDYCCSIRGLSKGYVPRNEEEGGEGEEETLDNCPVHPQVNHLTNVELKFLPPNITSKIQTLDQGIIKTFKMYY